MFNQIVTKRKPELGRARRINGGQSEASRLGKAQVCASAKPPEKNQTVLTKI
jgi:hypothetical protein